MPDVAPNSLQRKIIASTPPKQQKKAGTPKAKGSVRAKSGCYTCRIRRKKCDETPDEDGNCQTCVRLRLQCLGFGAKRPDWMRENNSVMELREKIKTFLASQGMIKGHSGTGPRAAEQDPSILLLTGDQTSSSRGSPPTPTLSASSSDLHRPHGPVTSFVRDGPHYPSISTDHHYSHTGIHPHLQELSPDSPMGPRGHVYHSDVMLPPYQPPPLVVQSPSTSLVSLPSSSWLSNASNYPSSYPSTSYLGPAGGSTFSPSYNTTYVDDYDDPTDPLDTTTRNSTVNAPTLPRALHVPIPMISNDQSELVQHYMNNVLNIQYLLADKSISSFIFALAQQSSPARDAVCLLSSLHRHRMRQQLGGPRDDMDTFYSRTRSALRSKAAAGRGFSEGDAMAGLHVVSSFLFSGGRGPWREFLDVACSWVEATLNDTRFHGPADAMHRCTESTRFIIKTSMWFEVLASATELSTPRFLSIYRALWGRGQAFIEDPTLPLGSGGNGVGSDFSMLSVMGCESQTFLAMAEISALAHWKHTQMQLGCLSVPQLVERGHNIEQMYLQTPYDTSRSSTTTTSSSLYDAYGSTTSEMNDRRRYTAEVFRASTRVYLHSILSGDFPSCPEIAARVAETIECLKRVPDNQAMSRSVVRSVVFSICICGCLTDDSNQRAFLLKRLQEQQVESAVGNIAEVRQLMETVWTRRVGAKGREVSWRDVMRECGTDMLLLV